jgi:AcrR family transcriptional regulator
MYLNMIAHMKTRKRLTREESREATRARLIEAGERVFIRKGFDDASVEEISETAGYSRGAFYSNFADKDGLFLAVVDRNRLDVVNSVEDIFRRVSDPAERLSAIREWYASRWRMKDFIALRMEFSRRAMKNRSLRKRLAELWRQEFETYAASIARGFGASAVGAAERPETVALALLAVIHGLGNIAIDTGSELEHLYDAAAKLVFDRLSAPESPARATE